MENENIPRIHFLYPTISEIMVNELKSALLFKALNESFSDKYLIVRDSRNKMVAEIRSIHALYNDLASWGNSYMHRYNELILKYGFATVDKIFIKDEDVVRNSILNTINFVMDEMYKVDELIIQFNLFREGFNEYTNKRYKETSDILNILYYVIQENFIIIENHLVSETTNIHFKKRR